jgi:hypothetical protein
VKHWRIRRDSTRQPSDASMFVKRTLELPVLGGERGGGVEGAVELAGAGAEMNDRRTDTVAYECHRGVVASSERAILSIAPGCLGQPGRQLDLG